MNHNKKSKNYSQITEQYLDNTVSTKQTFDKIIKYHEGLGITAGLPYLGYKTKFAQI